MNRSEPTTAWRPKMQSKTPSGEPKSRRNVDPRGVWMHQNVRTTSFQEGRWQGVPMHALRITTMGLNANRSGDVQ